MIEFPLPALVGTPREVEQAERARSAVFAALQNNTDVLRAAYPGGLDVAAAAATSLQSMTSAAWWTIACRRFGPLYLALTLNKALLAVNSMPRTNLLSPEPETGGLFQTLAGDQLDGLADQPPHATRFVRLGLQSLRLPANSPEALSGRQRVSAGACQCGWAGITAFPSANLLIGDHLRDLPDNVLDEVRAAHPTPDHGCTDEDDRVRCTTHAILTVQGI